MGRGWAGLGGAIGVDEELRECVENVERGRRSLGGLRVGVSESLVRTGAFSAVQSGT